MTSDALFYDRMAVQYVAHLGVVTCVVLLAIIAAVVMYLERTWTGR